MFSRESYKRAIRKLKFHISNLHSAPWTISSFYNFIIFLHQGKKLDCAAATWEWEPWFEKSRHCSIGSLNRMLREDVFYPCHVTYEFTESLCFSLFTSRVSLGNGPLLGLQCWVHMKLLSKLYVNIFYTDLSKHSKLNQMIPPQVYPGEVCRDDSTCVWP